MNRFVLRALSYIVFVLFSVMWTACGGESPKDPASGGAVEKTEAAAAPAVTDTYRSQHDPDAFYTRDTINFTGSYLKVEMDDLTPDQFNRVIHRLMTEKSTCGSGNTIDECLVNRPACWTATELLKQVIREEKLKG